MSYSISDGMISDGMKRGAWLAGLLFAASPLCAQALDDQVPAKPRPVATRPAAHTGGKGLDGKKPVEINADSLEVIQQQGIAVFRGNVIAVQGDTRINSDTMTVHYSKKETPGTAPAAANDPTQSKIQRIDVDGHVLVTNPDESASGNNGFYDVEHKQVYLFGDVVLTRGKNILKGDTLVYDVNTEKSVINSPYHTQKGTPNGRVRALFVPEKAGENPPGKEQ